MPVPASTPAEANEEVVLGADVNFVLDGLGLEQNGEGPDLEGDADEQRHDGEEIDDLPGHRIGAPAGDEAQRETEDDADGGHGAVAEGGVDAGWRLAHGPPISVPPSR